MRENIEKLKKSFNCDWEVNLYKLDESFKIKKKKENNKNN
jgi:hypothetical protein